MIEIPTSWEQVKRIRPNWFGIFLVGGTFLAVGSWGDLYSGERRFNAAIAHCEKKLTQLDPPVYTLKPTSKHIEEICMKLDQGVPSKEILAQFEEQAQKAKPLATAKVGVGAASAVGALVFGFGPLFIRKNRSE